MLIRCWPRRPSAPARPWPTEADHLPVERGLQVQDPGVLERRELIKQVMCHVQVSLELERFACEWRDLQDLAADGLVQLEGHADVGEVRVTAQGRWLIRSIAAVFDPEQRRLPSGSRLV